MPTASRLAAAFYFAALAFLISEVYKIGVPERSEWGYFSMINAGIGLVCGWRVMAAQVDKRFSSALAYGLRTTVTLVFWMLFVFSFYQMILRSMSLHYEGPGDAILSVFLLVIENAQPLANLPMGIILVGGGLLSGVFVQWVGERWR